MPFTALIMAAQRKNEVNPLAVANGVSHKCLMDMDGLPMIQRVYDSLAGSQHIGRIIISIDDAAALDDIAVIQDGVASGKAEISVSGDNPFASVLAALDDASLFPVIVTTGDNALHTTEIINYYCEKLLKSDCDVSVGFTNETDIHPEYLAKLKESKAPHRFRDGRYSNCNLFGLRTIKAIHSAKAFEGGGQFGKKKIRFFKAFGLVNLLIYKYGLLSLDAAFNRLSSRFGVKFKAIMMPFPEAPIDVDNPNDEALSRKLLAARRATG